VVLLTEDVAMSDPEAMEEVAVQAHAACLPFPSQAQAHENAVVDNRLDRQNRELETVDALPEVDEKVPDFVAAMTRLRLGPLRDWVVVPTGLSLPM
jgi:hypothetical protein